MLRVARNPNCPNHSIVYAKETQQTTGSERWKDVGFHSVFRNFNGFAEREVYGLSDFFFFAVQPNLQF